PDPAAEIAATIAAYARAIDSRDMSQLRKIHPGMTDEERRGFQDFFTNTRSLHASLSVVSVQADSVAADAQIAGSYEYVTTAGRSERQPVSFRALLRRDGSSWKLVAVK
ncbi:MAG TPA: hypothetical protein VJU87_04235, partial [Gemmatimonadaceae bacterium]|nr:hypothetical protein [Gemmatimonadaceae bacterium]